MDHFERFKAVGSAGQACYQIIANERGQTITVLACFNAVRTFAPLLFVLKGSRLQAKLCVGAPAGSLVRVSPNGWITSSLFAKWAVKFVASLPSNDHLPHVLLLDGHASHVYNLEFLNVMKAKNVRFFASHHIARTVYNLLTNLYSRVCCQPIWRRRVEIVVVVSLHLRRLVATVPVPVAVVSCRHVVTAIVVVAVCRHRVAQAPVTTST